MLKSKADFDELDLDDTVHTDNDAYVDQILSLNSHLALVLDAKRVFEIAVARLEQKSDYPKYVLAAAVMSAESMFNYGGDMARMLLHIVAARERALQIHKANRQPKTRATKRVLVPETCSQVNLSRRGEPPHISLSIYPSLLCCLLQPFDSLKDASNGPVRSLPEKENNRHLLMLSR